MSRRRVRPDELALWRQVAETAKPLEPRRTPEKQSLFPPKPAKRTQPGPEPIQPFTLGARARGTGPSHDVMPDLTDRLRDMPVTMDRRAYGKLKRGKLKPEARIDLHGMTVDRAHSALSAFILRAHGQGKRLVLVITGKGRRADDDGPIPVRQGVLRHNVPHWLSVPPLNQVVMQVSAAHLRHGGGGAYYVYLRRRAGG